MNATFSRRSPFGQSFPQALATGSSPTFAGLTLTGAFNINNSSVTITGSSTTQLYITVGGSRLFAFTSNNGGSLWGSAQAFAWSSETDPGSAGGDLFLYRDAADTLARRNGTTAQEDRIYARFTSTSDYARRVVKWATTTLSAVTGASVTATSLVPARAQMLDGVISKVTTALGVTGGTTGYAVGTSGDPNQWGDIVGTATTTASGTANFTASPNLAWSASAQDVVVTAAGGNFDGTGAIYLAVPYSMSEAD